MAPASYIHPVYVKTRISVGPMAGDPATGLPVGETSNNFRAAPDGLGRHLPAANNQSISCCTFMRRILFRIPRSR
jgi:hypothetical protein